MRLQRILKCSRNPHAIQLESPNSQVHCFVVLVFLPLPLRLSPLLFLFLFLSLTLTHSLQGLRRERQDATG